MKNIIKSLVAITVILLASCAHKAGGSSQGEREDWNDYVSELEYWDANPYFERKTFGKIFLTFDKAIPSDSILKIFDYDGIHRNKMNSLGKIQDKTFEIALLRGRYSVVVRTDKSNAQEPVYRSVGVDVTGGETLYLHVVGKDILTVTKADTAQPNLVKGTLYNYIDVYGRLKAVVSATYDVSSDGKASQVRVNVKNSNFAPTISVNGKLVNYEKVNSANYKLTVNFLKGDNELAIEAKGHNGELVSRKYVVHVTTDKELADELKAAKELSRKLAEEERQRLLLAEKEAKAKKAEEARIAREGDGTPDDLSCKKYGLKPQTQGYSECRMRLDLARQDAQREQAKASAASNANAKAREDARKAELERRYEEVQRQNAIVANRESKCRFVQSAEYAKPALGGFFESMNRANSAYDNCMAGIPQINTTCSKDSFGNINCTSR